MSTKLPVVSGDQLARALERTGWTKVRQNGSHMRFERDGKPSVTVPRHRTVKPGTLAGILKDAGMTAEELRALL
jgi:predicted RNA binding protein YcfA (HicA-like mRNA interferase family)